MSFGHLNHGKPPLEVAVVTGSSSTIVELPTNTAAAAIAAGDVVAFATAAAATEAGAFALVRGAVNGAAVGVALEASTGAGEVIRVCVGGYVEGVACAAGVANGEAVMAVAAGEVDTNTAASVQTPVAVALSNRVGTTVTLYWFRKY